MTRFSLPVPSAPPWATSGSWQPCRNPASAHTYAWLARLHSMQPQWGRPMALTVPTPWSRTSSGSSGPRYASARQGGKSYSWHTLHSRLVTEAKGGGSPAASSTALMVATAAFEER
jgi:hypothetical protein